MESFVFVLHKKSMLLWPPASPKGALRASLILSWDLLSTVDLQKASDFKEIHQYTVRQMILHFRPVATLARGGSPPKRTFFLKKRMHNTTSGLKRSVLIITKTSSYWECLCVVGDAKTESAFWKGQVRAQTPPPPPAEMLWTELKTTSWVPKNVKELKQFCHKDQAKIPP